MGFRDLTLKDMEDLLITTKGSILDVLIATLERAIQLQEAAEEKPPPFDAAVPRKKRTAIQRRTQIAQQQHLDHPPPSLPEKFKNVIEEMARGKELTAATLVIEKGLYDSDVSVKQRRLSIPLSLISDDFLTEEERRRVRSEKDNRIDVRIVEPSGAVATAEFWWRDMTRSGAKKASTCYMIKGRKWNEIVARNSLESGMVVQLWCFRVDGELCFALVPLPPNPAGDAA